MPLFKNLLGDPFPLPECEKHFHDQDETWIIVSGKGTGYWIGHNGVRENFILEAGDVWMVPAGYEHGSEGPNSEDFRIVTSMGTSPEGSHRPRHYYMEREGYIPTLQLQKTPTNRYERPDDLPAQYSVVVFPEKGQVELQTVDFQAPGTGWVVCRTLFSGISSGTEANQLRGGNYVSDYPVRPGYQAVGQVEMVGGNVTEYRAGDIVFSGHFVGHGQFFRTAVKPEGLTVKLSPDDDLAAMSLLGISAVAVHGVKRADVRFGQKALVVGAGPLGLLAAQVARAAGADVTICDINCHRLSVASECGLAAVDTSNDDGWQSLIASSPFDVILDYSGAPILGRLLGEGWDGSMLVPKGVLLLAAGREDVQYSFNAGQSRETTIVHTSHFNRSDLLLALDLKRRGLLEVPLKTASTDNLADIYKSLMTPSSEMGIAIDWRSL